MFTYMVLMAMYAYFPSESSLDQILLLLSQVSECKCKSFCFPWGWGVIIEVHRIYKQVFKEKDT